LILGFSIANYRSQIANSKMRLRHKFRGTDGAEIAEAALVMPVVFIFLLGIIWFGRAFNIYSTITQAAQQGVLVAARPVCASCTATAGLNGEFQKDTPVVDAVSAVMQASSLDMTQVSAGAPIAGCSTTNSIQICRELVLSAPSGGAPQFCSPPGQPPLQSQVCGATVSFRYPVALSVPFTSLAAGSVTLNAQAQSRMEN
jgi:hypothetical protein